MNLIRLLTPVFALIVCGLVQAADDMKWPSHQPVGHGDEWIPLSSAPSGTQCSRDWGHCGCDKPCGSMFDLLPEYPLPRFYARFRGLALMRDGDDYVPFAALGATPQDEAPNIVLDSDDVELPFQGGGEVFIGYRVFNTHYLEFTFFDLSTANEQAAVRDSTPNAVNGDGDLFSPFGDFGLSPLDQFDYNNFAAVRLKSKLSNYELNLRHILPMPPGRLRSSFLVGIRATQTDDHLSYQTTSDIPALLGNQNSIGTMTKNRLFGAQIGGLFELHVDPGWWVNFEIDAAICHNDITLDSVYTQTSGVGGSVTHAYQRSESNTSFVGEIVLSLVYECNQHLTTEVGYRAMWITGLALGTENLQTDPNLLVLGPPALNDDGAVVYHGPHLGVTVRW